MIDCFNIILFMNIILGVLAVPVERVQGLVFKENGLFEGDISGVEFLVTNKGLSRIPSSSYVKWPGGVVPYTIDANTYNATQMDAIYEGIRWIEESTRVNGKDCIKFVPRKSEATYVRIANGNGCSSSVGMKTWSGAQLVILQKPSSTVKGSCIYPGVVAHELIHALGFWHEQSRPDRDKYVKINWENIDTANQQNFNKLTSGVDTMGFPYDYYSIMHYQSDAFSKNGKPTIEPLVPGVELIDAKFKTSLTQIDIDEIRKYYSCN